MFITIGNLRKLNKLNHTYVQKHDLLRYDILSKSFLNSSKINLFEGQLRIH